MINLSKSVVAAIFRHYDAFRKARALDEVIDTDCDTDYERWRELASTTGRWNPSRAQRVAAVIPDGARVLDLGAGSMVLKNHLKPHCIYIPADIYDRGQGCIVVDLNKFEFPDGRYDWVTMIGLIEYLKDPRWVLTRAGQAAPRIITSYNPTNAVRNFGSRRNTGWICHLSEEEFVRIVHQAGFKRTIMVAPPVEGEIILLGERVGP
jgi:hypothetical protein